MKHLSLIYKISLSLLIGCSLSLSIYAQEDSSDYVKRAQVLKTQDEFEQVYETVDTCIKKFSAQAEKLAVKLTEFPLTGEMSHFQVMNDVATCYFIKGESLRDEGKTGEAKKVLKEVIDKYPYAQGWDPRGWYYSIAEKSEIIIAQIEGRRYEAPDIIEEEIKVVLYDRGSEFPVNYSKYGEFKGMGTKDYEYVIEDPIGLSEATGVGIHPNTTSLKFDPKYVEAKKNLFKVNHWQILNGRDLRTAFYKWNFAPETPAIRLFNIADILERSGELKHAVKAYYAIVVHFPRSYAWTYWHTPWYVAKTALYRLQHILKTNPGLGLKLVGAKIQVINGYDNDIRNDVFIVNPGQLRKMNFWEKYIKPIFYRNKKRKLGKIVQSRGGKTRVVKYQDGDWQLLVNDKPFIIKGITYDPTRVGESPDDQSMQNWTTQDINNNDLIDAPFESWVDKNRNNIQDPKEVVVGDFQLMKEMGVNAIRLYHQPFKRNKELIRKLYNDYGIHTIFGDFLGKYTLGSGAKWEEGTDYDNPDHKRNMLKSVRQMVLEFKDEEAILFWLLGNENVYGLGCNADKKPESFFKFANEAALLIKSLDPHKRPVAIASGDTIYLDIFAKHCPDIDIFGTNSYRGKHGFLDVWDEVKMTADRAAMITEYGAPSYAKGYSREEAETYQANYHGSCWLDIMGNSAGFGAGNAIGGIVYEWVDEWWKAYEPIYQDKKGLFSGPFLGGYMLEEWLGLTSQGNGENSPFLRQLKKSYFTYKDLWRSN